MLQETGTKIIPPRSGVGFKLAAGERLKVTDLQGEQVSDLMCFAADDVRESLSSGRTIDYLGRWLVRKGDTLYSNRSRPMLEIVEDTVGRHDFLLTPCSSDTFRILYGHQNPHRGCHGNLTAALEPYGIGPDDIPVTLNVFMNVALTTDGAMSVLPPLSRAGDVFVVEAKMDLIVGLTACSAEQSNNGSFKPIGYEVLAKCPA